MLRNAMLCAAAIWLAGCSTDEQLYQKWQQAGSGGYRGPVNVSGTPMGSTSYASATETTPQDRVSRGYHPGMYYGFSTVTTPMGTHRDDRIVGTFKFPYSTSGTGAVGYNPTVNQAVRGTSLGVRSGVVPGGERPPRR